MTTKPEATIADLYHIPNNAKAELVAGEVVLISPTGDMPSRAAGTIYLHLRLYERETGRGYAYAGNTRFIVDLPNRRSFSPDAAFYTGERTGMRFLQGAPIFAVEVRSEGDYGPEAERAIAQKRRDYFAAGTVVVWDVDLLSDEMVRVYRATDPDHPAIYRRGKRLKQSRHCRVGPCR